MKHPESNFLAACLCRPVARLPVWMMRQAGRYLPEYRAVREKVGFLELCKTPELAAEVTLQPIRRFGFDAAILFSDIMIPVEAMGVDLAFDPGPVISHPVRDRSGIEALRVPDPDRDLPFVAEAVRLIVAGLPAELPCIGFCGAPFTLGAYLVEGRGSRDFARYKAFMWRNAEDARHLMRKLAETVAVCLEAQVAAGARAVQIFDSWTNILAPEDFSAWVAPVMRDLIARLRESTGVPVIYFARGTGAASAQAGTLGASVVGLDWTVRPEDALACVPQSVALQGNLDPTLLFADLDTLEARTRAMLSVFGPRPGYIVNLGHGILPDTPTEAVQRVVELAHAYQP